MLCGCDLFGNLPQEMTMMDLNIILFIMVSGCCFECANTENAFYQALHGKSLFDPRRSLDVTVPNSGQFIRFNPFEGHNGTTGRIEVYLNGSFTPVCTDGWDLPDAHVACQQLGYARGAVRIPDGNPIRRGTEDYTQIKMTRVRCDSSDIRLQDCRFETSSRCTTEESVRVECRQNTGCPEDWAAGPTGCYKITPNTVTRREFAVNKCMALGGHLLSIETEAEHNFVTSQFLRDANGGPLITGGIRTDGQWVWERLVETSREDSHTVLVQSPIRYNTPWFPGWQPGNILAEPSNEKKERCLFLSRNFLHPNGSDVTLDYLYWTDDNCISTRKRLKSGFNYICERPITVPEDTSCFNGTGIDYRGEANTTEKGLACLNWIKSEEINPETYPGVGLGDHNYCRNPDGDERPWCWVGQDTFGFCNIPVCKQEAAIGRSSCSGDEYRCGDGSCIPKLWHCDMEPDCENEDDEGESCDYKLELFRKTDSRSIRHLATETYVGASNETCAKYCLESTKFVCQSFSYNSHTRDCYLSEINSDTHKSRPSRHEAFYELITQLDNCEGMFRCSNKRCIKNDLMCDGHDDCRDFSDESSCAGAEEVEVRLVDGENEREGRVEVKYGGEWGVVCDDEWDSKDADVICSMLGFNGESESLLNSYFGEGNGHFMLDQVECLGNETSIDECQHAGWKMHDCNGWETVGVRCSVIEECPVDKEYQCTEDNSCLTLNKFCDTECDCPECSDEGDCDIKLDLVGGRVPSEGRIHIAFGDKNGTICDDNFDKMAADVVCRTLGYSSGVAVESSLFGPGEGIVWMDNIACQGNEEHIIDCPHLGPLDNDCGHDEDVGVICRSEDDLRVELVDSPDEYAGRVELIKNGERGTICDDDWDDNDAAVICKMLGFSGGKANGNFGPGSDSIHIFMDDVDCTGSESSIEDCTHSDWLVHNCDHTEDAGVVCISNDEMTSTTKSPSATPAPIDCFDGIAYKGTTSQTENGLECQRWAADIPHKHKYHEDSGFPGESVVEARNYCRNPDNDTRPWCYTTDPGERWEYCTIPKCIDNCYSVASEYNGPTSHTSSGKNCQQWNKDAPHHHKYHSDDVFPDGSVVEAANHCRAPDDDASPWCYTTDPDTRWEYCDIPRCGGGFDFNSTCGLRPLQSRVRREILEDDEFTGSDVSNPLYRNKGRIIGGSTVSYGMTPWQVAIRLKYSDHESDHTHHCGGILIGEYWVLCAAHCFRDVYKGQVVVSVGDHHTHKPDEHEQLFKVDAIYSHEQYKAYGYDYDIALLKLRPVHGRGVAFNDYIQPACLPDVNTRYEAGQKCLISGWGVYRQGRKSSYLRAARVPLVSYNTCNKLYKYSLTPRMTCAGYLEGGTDSCAGDSGGPLVCEINDKFTVMGVTSFGDGCGLPNNPGVYTRVASFIPWINQKLSEHS